MRVYKIDGQFGYCIEHLPIFHTPGCVGKGLRVKGWGGGKEGRKEGGGGSVLHVIIKVRG